LRKRLYLSGLIPVVFFTCVGFLVMGYHPGAEDDGVYLAAVKSAAAPALYPHDAAFFKLQMRTSVFDTWMAQFVHATGLSIAWSEFLWQWVSLFLMLLACWLILCELFEERPARWGGLAMLAAMLTIPVAGTALYIADQYLHPRNPATALILLAVARVIKGKRWQAVPLLLLAFILHPLMGAFGVSFCFVLTLTFSEPVRQQVRSWRAQFVTDAEPETEAVTPVGALVPFGWLLNKPSSTYLDAIRTRHSYLLFQWTWYEWLGAIGPLVIFWIVGRVARKQNQTNLARFASAILIYAVFHQLLAMVLVGPPAFVAFTTLEPMRYLQLVYVFLALIGGAYLGKCLLKQRAWRWCVFLLAANGGMFIAQRQLFASTEHIEIPGRPSGNAWLQAFDWSRTHTPEDAYFAIDPNYMSAAGEDNLGFRALAERSVLADADKDAAVVTKSPELGEAWTRQVQATAGWQHFQLSDFQRLNREFGVDWVLVSYPAPAGLACSWHNQALSVCQIPAPAQEARTDGF
jgi:hypothetical protein